MSIKSKETRGGKRRGAGRKPSPLGKTKQVRIPVVWEGQFKMWMKEMYKLHAVADLIHDRSYSMTPLLEIDDA